MATQPRWPKLLFNLVGFEIGWLLCVLGGSWVALATGLLLIGGHLRFIAHPGEWRLLAGFAGLGLVLDGSLTLLGGFDFSGHTQIAGLLPLWLWMLWPLFATLLRHSLAWLWRFPLLAAAGGAISGPLSYYGGGLLADVTLAPWLLPVQSLIWGLLCYLLARNAARLGLVNR